MSYEPKTWETGEVIEAEDLNHMENGIGYYDCEYEIELGSITLHESYNDIVGAVNAGKVVILRMALGEDTYILMYLDSYELAPAEDDVPATYTCLFGAIASGSTPDLTFTASSSDVDMVASTI